MAKKLIMVVDDESDIRDSIKIILTKNGYSVLTAINGDDCLEKLKKAKPSLILMDIMMPGMLVRDVLKKIKGMKIILVSVVRTTEAEKEDLLKNPNIVGFIQKPFDINELLAAVKKQL
ncbi:MAG: response regulator [archaeon]